MEALREHASVRPLPYRLKTWAQVRQLDYQAWLSRRQVARLVATRVQPVNLLRPYFTPLMPWNSGALVEAAGGGVILEVLRQARQQETMRRQSEPYFNGLQSEVAYREENPAEALELAERALALLAKEEVLLRGRLQAIAADAALQLGKNSLAEGYFHQVLERFPTALRILRIPLPVRALSDQHPLSQRVAETLLRSRRLRSSSHGFIVRVTEDKRILILCLENPSGQRYGCAFYSPTLDPSKGRSAAPPSEEETVARAIDTFHRKVFAPKVDLTQRDINSLDGSAVRGDADELIKDVLGK
jgi:hypothetical protein